MAQKMKNMIESLMKDYEGFVKPRLSLDFVPLEKAKSKDLVFERIGDIALSTICILNSGEQNSVVIHISQVLADIMGVSKETLMKDALKNTKNVASPVLLNLAYVMTGKEIEKPQILACMDQNFIAGSAVIMIPEFLQEIIEKFEGEDFYVVPSSRKELVLARKGTASVERIKRTIAEVNGSDLVGDDDFLSNNVFIFDSSKKQLSMCESY